LDLEVDGDRLPGEVEGRRLIKERLDVSGRGVGVVANSPRSLIKERLDVSGRGVGVVAISPRSFTTCDQKYYVGKLRQKVFRFN
jgi:hypothetical protein